MNEFENPHSAQRTALATVVVQAMVAFGHLERS